MNSELTVLKTAAQVKKYFKGRGHAMVYGDQIIASNRIWTDEGGVYDHFAAIFDILERGDNDTHTLVALAAESDEAFSDQGHAFAWAIGMVTARN